MEYRRLKSTNGSGTIMRYFDLAEGEEAKANRFYEIKDEKAHEIKDGSKPTGNIIGFSHGGNKLVEKQILLDINPAIVYVAEVTDAGSLPKVGDVKDDFMKVIDVHKNDLTYEFVIGLGGIADNKSEVTPNPQLDEAVVATFHNGSTNAHMKDKKQNESTIITVITTKGQPISADLVPTVEADGGYTFDGWNPECTGGVTVIDDNITFEAKVNSQD